MKRSLSIGVLVFIFLSGQFVLGGKKPKKAQEFGSELARAPKAAQGWQNPYAGQPNAALAGRKLFDRHCASCHGPDGRGRDEAPDLRSPVVQNASVGTMFWFLKNGNIREGMPSWSRLPDQQLWQLVTFLQAQGQSRDGPSEGQK